MVTIARSITVKLAKAFHSDDSERCDCEVKRARWMRLQSEECKVDVTTSGWSGTSNRDQGCLSRRKTGSASDASNTCLIEQGLSDLPEKEVSAPA